MSERRLVQLVLGLWLGLAVAGVAQSPMPPGTPPEMEAFTLEYQAADAAVDLVRPLLSEDGTVELQPGRNTLVVRDTPRYLMRVRSLLESFDHPPFLIRFTVRVVEARTSAAADGEPPPPALEKRLRRMLRFRSFNTVGQAQLSGLEGQTIRYRIGDDFRVEFEVGTLLGMRRLKLAGFRVHREQSGDEPLIHTQLNLVLGQTLVLGLARDEESESALMIVIDSGLGGIGPRSPRKSEVGDNPGRS